MLVLIFLVALASASSPSPSPSPAPVPLKEIGSVRSTPYCSAFYGHFNAAVHPMLVNDVALDHINVSLEHQNELFKDVNWEQEFIAERLTMQKNVQTLIDNNGIIQKEVNDLRKGETMTSDKEQSHEIHMLAQELQRALDKQKQLQVDLLSVVHVMMDFDLSKQMTAKEKMDATLDDLSKPADLLDIKKVMRFDGQRDRLHDAERMAADHAATILQKYC
ncbi:MAG: hypothetical protein ABR584_02930 [Candidatus Baltobacteraceae bacterium]